MAETLFHEQGYQAVSMRDIAKALGIRQASLYYHVPEGKEQLYVEVMTRNFERHGSGLRHCIEKAEESLRAQLKAIADWFVIHAPLGLLGMMRNDLQALSTESRQQLQQVLFQHIWHPIQACFEAAVQRGEAENVRYWDLTGAFLSLMDGLTLAGTTGFMVGEMGESADYLIDLLMDGLLKKNRP
jgi:AcrR family transcriptional regulator